MKIKEQTPTRLVLAGVPGGLVWMVFATVFGLAITAVCVVIAVGKLKGGWSFDLIGLGVGVLIGQAFLWMGAVTLAVGRQRLVLDLEARQGRYFVRSPIVDTGNKTFEFDLADVAGVVIARRTERSPTRGTMDAEVVSAELRVRTPRKKVVLAETQNGREARVRAVAEAVAGFLALEVGGEIEEADASIEPNDAADQSGAVGLESGKMLRNVARASVSGPWRPTGGTVSVNDYTTLLEQVLNIAQKSLVPFRLVKSVPTPTSLRGAGDLGADGFGFRFTVIADQLLCEYLINVTKSVEVRRKVFELLRDQRVNIEATFGQPLVWDLGRDVPRIYAVAVDRVGILDEEASNRIAVHAVGMMKSLIKALRGPGRACAEAAGVETRPFRHPE